MRGVALWLSLAALPGSAGCAVAESFACTADAQCMADGAAGRCEVEGVCSFPDDACPSGHRYGALAGGLSGECVGEGSSGAASSEADTRASALEDTLDVDGSSTSTSTSSTSTTGVTSSTSTTDGMSTSDSTSTTDPSMTGPSTTTGTEPNPYGPCMDDDQCEDPTSVCITGPTGVSVCAPLCEANDLCPPAPDTMGAQIVCTVVPNGTMGCVIICSDDSECPPGMHCEPVDGMGIGYCGWL